MATDAPRVTVLTPTYNRARTLGRVYDSLAAQTMDDFEWLIVDDGSTDDTVGRVADFQARAAFPITYVPLPHAGKHSAYNEGVRRARGQLVIELASDDECLPEALAALVRRWDEIPAAARDGFVGVSALARYSTGGLVGSRFPRDVLDSDAIELRFTYHVKGDKWSLNRRDVLLEYLFEEPGDPTFISEDIVWFAIARRYRTRFVNEVLLVVHVDPAAGDQLTSLRRDVVVGRLDYHRFVLNELVDQASRDPLRYLASAVNVVRYSLDAGRSLGPELRRVRPRPARVLTALSVPAGWFFARRDRSALSR